MPWFQIIQLILGIVPMVEQLFPQSGAGNQKLALVLNTVKAAATAVPTVIGAVQAGTAAVHAGNVEALSGNITQAINGVVSGLNAAGVFQKSAIVQSAKPQVTATFTLDQPAQGASG